MCVLLHPTAPLGHGFKCRLNLVVEGVLGGFIVTVDYFEGQIRILVLLGNILEFFENFWV